MAGENPTRGSRSRGNNNNWKGGRTITEHGYVLIRVGVGHPLSDVRGYAYEHRLKAWQAGHDVVGKHVHHDDHVKQNNATSNLIPLTPAEHRAEHRKAGSNKRLPNEPNSLVSCACGCGQQFLKYDTGNRPRRFISGHNTEVANPPAFCSCGCGKRMTKFNPKRIGLPQYLYGHRPPPPNPTATCGCGCGGEFPLFDSGRRMRVYLPGHNSTGRFTKGHALNAH